MDYLNEGVEEFDDEIPSLEQIKAGILRRQYVNSEDIGYLGYILEQELGSLKFYSTWVEELKDEPHEIINTDNKEAIKRLINFWNEIGFEYRKKSESELIIWKEKKPSA